MVLFFIFLLTWANSPFIFLVKLLIINLFNLKFLHDELL